MEQAPADAQPDQTKKRRRWLKPVLLLLGVCAITAASHWLLRNANPEPVYQGRTVRDWLTNYASFVPATVAPSPFFVTNINGRIYVLAASSSGAPAPVANSQEALKTMIRLGLDPVPWILREVQRTDPGFGPTYRKFTARLSDRVKDVLPELPPDGSPAQLNGMDALVDLAPPEISAPTLIAALDHRSELVQIRATRMLGRLHEHAFPAVPILLQRFKQSENDSVSKLLLIDTFGRIGDRRPAVQELLLASLDSHITRMNALQALNHLYVRSDALDEVLARILRTGAASLPEQQLAFGLLSRHGSKSPAIRKAVLAFLGAYPSMNISDLHLDRRPPEIIGIVLDSPSSSHMREALNVLAYKGAAPEHLPRLREIVCNPDGEVRYKAVRAIESLGADAAPAIGLLQEVATSDTHTLARNVAARILANLNASPLPEPVNPGR